MSLVHQEAPPLSLLSIEASAWRFRQKIGQLDPWLEVERVLEPGLPVIFGKSAYFEVRAQCHMGDNHALADPDAKIIMLRNDVYDGMCGHKGRDRMTVMHEFGHLILHEGLKPARRMRKTPPEPYRCPEWQAKAWAGAVLVPSRLVADPLNTTPGKIAAEFGVSLEAAGHRLQQIKRLQRPKN